MIKAISLQCLEVDALQALSDRADEALEANPTDQQIEDEFDKAYSNYWEGLRELARMIVKISGNEIDEQTALKMAIHKREQITNIVGRAAQ